ncbi:MAG: TfoX/Sxy family protein [Candidatus Roizmanbacteria bacterium]
MSTSKGTAEFILEQLGNSPRFRVRAMFGEYALYADNTPVALICDDTLYLKITEANMQSLRDHEQGPPYPGARPHWIITERDMRDCDTFQDMLLTVARSIPAKKKKI